MLFAVPLIGFGFGLLFVIPPGPVAVTLLEVGVAQGRAAGVRSGFGIAAGDLAVGLAATSLVLVGGALPVALFDLIRELSSITLLGLGLVLLTRPTVMESVAGAIRRPGRALFLMTVLTPTVFGAWVALLAALPFADEPAPLVLFVVGATSASLVWHVTVGSMAGELGSRVRSGAVQRVARVSGAGFALVGLVTLLA